MVSKRGKILIGLVLIFIVIFMLPIEAKGSSIEINADLTVRRDEQGLGVKSITAYCGEELIFDAGFTIGIVNM